MTNSRHWHWSAARKLAMQHMRAPKKPLARSAPQSVFMGTMRAQNLEWLERFSLDRSVQLQLLQVPCLTRRGYCQDLDFETWLNRIPLSGVAGMLWTRLILSGPSFVQDVPKPIGHDHVVLDLLPVSGELDTQGLWIPQVWAHEVLGTWLMDLRRHEGHGKAARTAPWPPPGHHSGGERCVRVVLLSVHRYQRYWRKGLEHSATVFRVP